MRAGTLTVAEVFVEVYEQAVGRMKRQYVAPEDIPTDQSVYARAVPRTHDPRHSVGYFRGVPAIYANYIGYDEIAHHLGPRSTAAYRALKALDRQIRDVKKALDTVALRPYDLYIMSDHGMTESLPFITSTARHSARLSRRTGDTAHRERTRSPAVPRPCHSAPVGGTIR
jgi:hypothetical protein